MTNTQLPSLSPDALDDVTGGIDIGQIAQQIGGLVDKFAGTGGKGAAMGGQIGGMIQQLIGAFSGGGGQGGSGAPGGGEGGGAGGDAM